MHRAGADETAAVSAAGSRPATPGPTSLDRLLGWLQQAAPKLTRVSDLLFVGSAAVLAIGMGRSG